MGGERGEHKLFSRNQCIGKFCCFSLYYYYYYYLLLLGISSCVQQENFSSLSNISLFSYLMEQGDGKEVLAETRGLHEALPVLVVI